MLKELFLQWLSWRQAPKNIKKRNSALSRCYNSPIMDHKPPICFHRCILMLYIVFDNFHALLANPIRQDILRGGPKIDVFVFFLTLEFEFLMTYEVSCYILDLYIDANRLLWYLPYFQAFQGTISTLTGSLNFNSVCFPTLISNFSSPNLDRILSIHR